MNKQQIERAKTVWNSRYQSGLSQGEIEEIARNLGGFFDLIKKWDGQQSIMKKEDENGKPKTRTVSQL